MTDDDIEDTLNAVRRVTVAWTPTRRQRSSWAVMARIERRRRRRSPLLFAPVGAAAIAMGIYISFRPRPALPDAVRASASPSPISLDDATTALRKKVEEDSEILFEFEMGSWWGGSREVAPKQEGTFPPEPTAALPSRSTRRAPARVAMARAAHVQVLAPPELLFDRADRARRDGDNEAAIAWLRALVDAYPHDAHAPAAAFTIGRLLLETSQRPREAARAFKQARQLAAGKGALAEDALAREVEALHAAGDIPAARARAELYLELFPAGIHKDMVTTPGGPPNKR